MGMLGIGVLILIHRIRGFSGFDIGTMVGIAYLEFDYDLRECWRLFWWRVYLSIHPYLVSVPFLFSMHALLKHYLNHSIFYLSLLALLHHSGYSHRRRPDRKLRIHLLEL
jgi:hypothetical protein